MLVIADENMPFAAEAFSNLGEVLLVPGRAIDKEVVRGAGILAVRSVTRVDRGLLESSRVRFVGTATIGTDHVDREWLAGHGIGFASAPGCNAISVAEYITAALFVLAERLGFTLRGMKLGIVGVGNVGNRVSQRADSLGLEVIWNDPPLAASTGDPRYRPLEEIYDCDMVSVHVPLEKNGHHPTYHLLNKSFLDRLKPGAIVFNTSRGAVADNAALETALDSGQLAAAVLDVWEGEPSVRLSLLEKAAIATPHIAGYSYDGKVLGTSMIYRAACGFFGREATWNPSELLPAPKISPVRPQQDPGTEKIVGAVVKAAYPILEDDARMRGLAAIRAEDRAAYFDRLRKEYWVRREFKAFKVELPGANPKAEEILRKLGFKVIS